MNVRHDLSLQSVSHLHLVALWTPLVDRRCYRMWIQYQGTMAHPRLWNPLLCLTRRSAASPTLKRNGLDPHTRASRSHVVTLYTTLTLFPRPASALPTPSGMAASVNTTQVFASEYSQAYGHGRTSPSPSILSATLVQHPLNFSSSGVNIVNAVVIDPSGHSLYTISSDSKHTKLHSHRDNTEVATIDWNRSSPRMVFQWLARAALETESRKFVHGDSQFTWMQQSSRGFLIQANQPGLAVAKWHTETRSDALHLQIFQEALTEPGLVEAIILSIILLQSGHSLGDTLEPLMNMAPRYCGHF
ncbi:hypothetical protein EI94DRAFT_1748706 [Lactarius quietus]|nr:hypothetical protein EI94DRAFT_1748706 [Lactarius quietus]